MVLCFRTKIKFTLAIKMVRTGSLPRELPKRAWFTLIIVAMLYTISGYVYISNSLFISRVVSGSELQLYISSVKVEIKLKKKQCN